MTKTISREEIRKRLDNGGGITLVEALPKQHFDKEHLPGAVNIPHDEVREKAPAALPDKSATIVVYCANTQCQNSRQAATTLEEMGYSDVYEYVEGKQDWVENALPVEASA